MTMILHDPVDAAEAAERLDVQLDTIHHWRKRTKKGVAVGMPEPAATFGRVPVWEWQTLFEWAGRTGRLHSDELRAAYEAEFGEEAREYRNGGRLFESELVALGLSEPEEPPTLPKPRSKGRKSKHTEVSQPTPVAPSTVRPTVRPRTRKVRST